MLKTVAVYRADDVAVRHRAKQNKIKELVFTTFTHALTATLRRVRTGRRRSLGVATHSNPSSNLHRIFSKTAPRPRASPQPYGHEHFFAEVVFVCCCAARALRLFHVVVEQLPTCVTLELRVQ